MNLIEPTHPLLPIVRHCLKDRDVERPSSQQLCQTLHALKSIPQYQESSQQDLHQMLREKDTQLQANRETITQSNEQLHTKDIEKMVNSTRLGQATQENQTLQQGKVTLQHEAESRKRHLRRLNQELRRTLLSSNKPLINETEK